MAALKKILIVEDEAAIGRFCQRVLTREGFEVNCVANGEEAIAKLQEKEYDLILVDLRTPVMNGMQLYEHLHKHNPKLANRVIFTTGDIIDADVKEFLDSANRPLILKPFTKDELKTIVIENL